MKVVREVSLKDFEFWSGARALADKLTDEEFDRIEDILDSTGETYTETEINDMFWFDGDMIADWIGEEDEEAILSRCDEE